MSPGEQAATIAAPAQFAHRTHSQPAYSVRMPPSRTPAAPPEPATAPQAPSALLRSAPSEKVVVMIESAAGQSSARPEALDGPRGDQGALRLGEAADQAGGGEQEEAGDEHAAAAEQVGQAATEEQEAAEGEHVGVDDPGEVVLGELEVLPMVGSATLTIEASRTTTNWAMHSSASAIHRLSLYSCASVICPPDHLTVVRIIGSRVPVPVKHYTELWFRLHSDCLMTPTTIH